VSAANQTAQNAPLCTAIQPFYWEIGNATGSLASQSVGMSATGNAYTANSEMSIASASKWMYATYVVQKRNGTPAADDIPYLHFTSGHTNMNPGGCDANPANGPPTQTVDQCLALPGVATVSGGSTQGALDSTQVGRFYYNSGHLTVHASAMLGLGSATTADLTSAIQPVLEQGATFSKFGYLQGDLAGGVSTTPADYAVFLRNILTNKLYISTLLGTQAVCTNPATCATATYSPIDGPTGHTISNESWHYSLGHWVEDDPTPQPDGSKLGDGSFSSAGAFGFYPWIDSTKTYYGILARESLTTPASGSAYYNSVQCGRMIRKAFMTGQAQLSTPAEP
jgi:hypothetical protein